jgi:predicted AAA+ superfamily ATPase
MAAKMRELLYFLNPHWRDNPLNTGVPRAQYLQPLLANLEDRRDVQMLIGSRRAGKTTLIFQALQHLINERKIPVHEILYVSLDHLALAETPIPKIIETFRAEFLAFKNTVPSPTAQYRHDGLLIEYLYQGGYPEQILSPHPNYLADLLDAVINKDIIRVHGIKNPEVLNKLLLHDIGL